MDAGGLQPLQLLRAPPLRLAGRCVPKRFQALLSRSRGSAAGWRGNRPPQPIAPQAAQAKSQPWFLPFCRVGITKNTARPWRAVSAPTSSMAFVGLGIYGQARPKHVATSPPAESVLQLSRAHALLTLGLSAKRVGRPKGTPGLCRRPFRGKGDHAAGRPAINPCTRGVPCTGSLPSEPQWPVLADCGRRWRCTAEGDRGAI